MKTMTTYAVALVMVGALTACAEPVGQSSSTTKKPKSEAELVYENCFANKDGFIDRYNGRNGYKAIVGGIKGQVGKRRMRCFSTANSKSAQRAKNRSFEQCREAGYDKCFLAADGIRKSDWVLKVEAKKGRSITLR